MSYTHLPADTNQARGLAEYAIAVIHGRTGAPGAAALARVERFHTDAVLCGLSALALQTNAPTVLRNEALEYPAHPARPFGTVFGSDVRVSAEKAVVANSAAVREWDSNGTNFGYAPQRGQTAGEFGHNDYYPVVMAAAQTKGLDGATALRAMLVLDEIRGRLAEVFSLKTYKIDHVLHGSVASAVVYGALLGATPDEIESAVGMTVAHYVPFRAIRAGTHLRDSKGASAAISTEAALTAVHRSMRGFLGPRDIFRNPEAVYRLFMPTKGDRSPFDLYLTHTGDDFTIAGMHFKLGLYEHQSAGAHQGLLDLLAKAPHLFNAKDGSTIAEIVIKAYEPAFGIIGDPAKRDPHTRQSADHSMVYIIATLLRKALQQGTADWAKLMLTPYDYHKSAIDHPVTRALMQKIRFEHGGPDYDARYPDGIPTSLVITDNRGEKHDSGLVMYPVGHARNTTADLDAYLTAKWRMLGAYVSDDADGLVTRLSGLAGKSAAEIAALYNIPFARHAGYE